MTADGFKPAADGAPWTVFAREIERSANDKQSYRVIRLSNGLTACLVTDPTLDKAAASLCVRVGQLMDPVGSLARVAAGLIRAQDEWPGLAHFAEHLLFQVPLADPADSS